METKKHHGTIKFFSYRRGYGFIIDDLMHEDVFFHFSSISNVPNMVVYLIPNEKVEYELFKGPRGYLAKNVSTNNIIRGMKNNNIYYHYYYSFRKIVDGILQVESEKDIQ